MAKIYYDSDCSFDSIESKNILFVGYGNQGSAQAQNLRDSGLKNIKVVNRKDHYLEDAKKAGFDVLEDGWKEAAEWADVLFLLIPDQAQPYVFNSLLLPHLRKDATIVVASGYNVFYNLLEVPATANVVMVAPRMIGISVRNLYVKGTGFPCFVSVEQDGTGNAKYIALALSKGIGATKRGAIESSCKEETMMDLFAEQALWPNIISLFNTAYSVLKENGCSDEALTYEMWMSKEPAEIFEKAAEEGFIQQLRHHSTVSQYGQLANALKVDQTPIRKHFEEVLKGKILSGEFAKEFGKLEEQGGFEPVEGKKDSLGKVLDGLYEAHSKSDLAQGEIKVRARLNM